MRQGVAAAFPDRPPPPLCSAAARLRALPAARKQPAPRRQTARPRSPAMANSAAMDSALARIRAAAQDFAGAPDDSEFSEAYLACRWACELAIEGSKRIEVRDGILTSQAAENQRLDVFKVRHSVSTRHRKPTRVTRGRERRAGRGRACMLRVWAFSSGLRPRPSAHPTDHPRRGAGDTVGGGATRGHTGWLNAAR